MAFFTPVRAGSKRSRVWAASPGKSGSNSDGLRTRRLWRIAWLTFRVQVDAFRYAPLGYLQAIAWRVRGLRLRSRNRLGALAGRSSLAYALWIERHEARPSSSPERQTLVVPVIDCSNGSAGLGSTLDSLAEAGAVEPIVIGGDTLDRVVRIERARELARLMARRETWLLPLRPGDRVAANSVSIYAETATLNHDCSLIYADDDLIGSDGVRQAPHFKPDWNPELFEHHDFVGGSSIIRVDREAIGELPDIGWTDILVREALRRGGVPVHVRQVLHHRASRPNPAVPAKPSDLHGRTRSVTAIIPTRNRHDLLRSCLEGLRKTAYPDIETIIVDNGSDEPETVAYLASLESEGINILRVPGPFNYSALNNTAVNVARGEVVCFLNNDLEMSDPDWLSLLVRHTEKRNIGAVGARLLYPDGTIQHAGVCTGIGGGAGHAHRFQRADDPGYFERASLPQRVSAVTGACLVVEKEKFLAVGGFDEDLFPVAFNDVDLCLKLGRCGWQSFYEPRSTLVHHESKSRGSDRVRKNRARFAGELASLKQRWNTDRVRDPFHHPSLSSFTEQFLIAV